MDSAMPYPYPYRYPHCGSITKYSTSVVSRGLLNLFDRLTQCSRSPSPQLTMNGTTWTTTRNNAAVLVFNLTPQSRLRVTRNSIMHAFACVVVSLVSSSSLSLSLPSPRPHLNLNRQQTMTNNTMHDMATQRQWHNDNKRRQQQQCCRPRPRPPPSSSPTP